jgi:hypothetical protein
MVKQTGVQSSKLNQLPYWDPVKSVVLGVMHNWFEGVLQHHVQYQWGLNGNLDQKPNVTPTRDASKAESGNYTTETDGDSRAEGYENKSEPGWWDVSQKKTLIRAVLKVAVPAGITQMPQGFGTAKNGKLKASEWHALFAIHLPLAVLDVLIDSKDIDDVLNQKTDAINNVCALVHFTNIVSARTVKPEDCELFKHKYKTYTTTSARIFPNLKILPNHHYALHIPKQMRWLGPLMAVSEFPGERLIGLLQKCKTNTQHSE